MGVGNLGVGRSPLEPSYEGLLRETRRRFESYESTIRKLRGRITEMESETYADEKMAEMRAEVEEARRAARNGFPITDDERERILEWQGRHLSEAHGIDPERDHGYAGAIGGAWEYRFLPTSIGVIGECRCNLGDCDGSLTFRELC